MPNSQFNKLRIKNGTQVTFNLSSNDMGVSDDEANFLHKLLLTDTQVRYQYLVSAKDAAKSTAKQFVSMGIGALNKKIRFWNNSKK